MLKFSFLILLPVTIFSFFFLQNGFTESKKESSAVANTLILFHDTTVATDKAKRLADRDSIMRYIPSLITNYDVRYFNQTTSFGDLSQYKEIFLIETSYDNGGELCLGTAGRSDIKNWLASATPANKRRLLSIGGDQGYNYDRINSANRDTVFSRTYCGFEFVVDAAILTFGTVIGVGIDFGIDRHIAPPVTGIAGFYPDGCRRRFNGGTTVYRYGNRTPVDTVAAIGKSALSYTTLTAFQDPRYFLNGNLKPWLQAIIFYMRGPGPDGITTLSGSADKYSLSQNYPNPFNPATKINFTISVSGYVSIKVFDFLGKEITELVNTDVKPGSYSLDFNGESLPSGMYFYALRSGNFTETRKMMLVK